MPVISPRILDRIQFNSKDVEDLLNLISARTARMQQTVIQNEEQYKNIMPVSYTHLDVYKRQGLLKSRRFTAIIFLLNRRRRLPAPFICGRYP